MESTSPLPYDENDGNGNAEKKKKRFFDEKTRNMCWNKAGVLQGRHPERWRKDSAGNTLCRKFLNCQGCLCYEYDHIIPFSKGGKTNADNCQILQSRVNRSKGNNEALDNNDLGRLSCDLKFTDKELDIIEMAVYGNVIRPGHQCHCKTVAEMLAEHKSKSPQIACELPYQEKY